MKKQRFLLFLAWFLYAVLYLLLIFPKLSKPIIGWDTANWELARHIVNKELPLLQAVIHPTLHDHLIALSFSTFGINEVSARLLGIVCFLLMPVVIYFLIKEITDRQNRLLTVFFANMLFLTSAVSLQGTLNINCADTSLLTMTIAIFYLFSIRTEDSSLGKRIILLGFLLSLCLWSKITTSMAILVAFFLYSWLHKGFKQGVKLSLGIYLLGGILFLISWMAYCHFLMEPSLSPGPLKFVLPTFWERASGFNLKRFVFNNIRPILWFSPLLLLLGLLATLDSIKNFLKTSHLKKEDQLIIFILVMFIGHFYLGSTTNSFPKYLVPTMPLLSCFIAKFVCNKIKRPINKNTLLFYISVFCFGIIYYFLFVGDWIYAIHIFRKAQLLGYFQQVIPKVAGQQLIYFAFPISIIVVLRLVKPQNIARKTICILLISTLSSSISLDIIQRQAKYSTNFCYGVEGIEELKDFLKKDPRKEIFTTRDGWIANIEGKERVLIDSEIWNHPQNLLAFLKENKPGLVITGLPCNTVQQLKVTLNNPKVAAYLNTNYKKIKIGSFKIFSKQ